MIRPKLLLCAEGAVVDKMTNNVSAFNILEQLNFRSLPVIIPRMVILNVLEREKDDPVVWKGKLRIELSGTVLLDQPLEHNFGDLARSRNLLTLGGLPITQPGVLETSLLEGEAKIITYKIDITMPPKVEVSQSLP